MLNKVRNIAAVSAAIIVVGFLSVRSIFDTDMEFSTQERRPLAQFPEFTLSTVLSGEFMKNFDSYVSDQFPYREEFRAVKAFTSMKVLGQPDYNRLYEYEGHLSKYEAVVNDEMIDYAADKFQNIYNEYLAGNTENIYLAVIPDKNYFLAHESGHPRLDYEYLTEKLQSRMTYADYIDVTSYLDKDDYYFTDTHWRQESVTDAAEYLASEMGTEIVSSYKEHILDVPFYGVYSGQVPWKTAPDTIRYLTNDTMDSFKVTSYASGTAKESAVYNFKKAEGKDPYEFFLSGSEPFLVIENPKAETEKELVIFRDSFGSSLAPLLAQGYSKTTVVDIRYMQSSFLGQLMEFDGQDVLFMYSDTLINNSTALK